jgi:glycerol-3-phosphate cytidylyltransferase
MSIYNTGLIAGNFDLIHPGYIFLFNECKDYCKKLVLCLHEDPSVERPEKHKPILTVQERILILSSLRQIDEIIVYKTEQDLLNILTNNPPEVRFLGDDYLSKSFTGDHLTIPIVFISRNHGWSTTKFKAQLKYL